ncbi:Uncharacterised protein [Streptococcus criceti]|nr:Uncharacterised protein [Streptococcus criceti]
MNAVHPISNLILFSFPKIPKKKYVPAHEA